jgi:hypothetical protein
MTLMRRKIDSDRRRLEERIERTREMTVWCSTHPYDGLSKWLAYLSWCV